MANVMVLGPDRNRTREVRTLLTKDGHSVEILPGVAGWRLQERQILPELVVAVVEHTEDVLSEPGRAGWGFAAPLLFLQQESDFYRDVDLDERLVDRMTSPFMQEELLARVDALVRIRRVVLHGSAGRPIDGETEPRGVRGIGRRMAQALRSRIPRYDKPLGAYLEVANRAAQWADRRDAFEPGHAERVTSLCAMVAESLGLGAAETNTLLRAAMLHDIGKIALPVEMLHQRQPLDDGQKRMIRLHPRRGAALIRALDRDEAVADAIFYHHERPDGRGYYGTDGSDIPMAARILAVAEVFDAMTSTRVRDPMSPEQALAALEESRGTSLDPDCVEALIDRMRPRRRALQLSAAPTPA